MSIEFGFSKFRKKLEFNLITVRTGAQVFLRCSNPILRNHGIVILPNAIQRSGLQRGYFL